MYHSGYIITSKQIETLFGTVAYSAVMEVCWALAVDWYDGG